MNNDLTKKFTLKLGKNRFNKTKIKKINTNSQNSLIPSSIIPSIIPDSIQLDESFLMKKRNRLYSEELFSEIGRYINKDSYGNYDNSLKNFECEFELDNLLNDIFKINDEAVINKFDVSSDNKDNFFAEFVIDFSFKNEVKYDLN